MLDYRTHVRAGSIYNTPPVMAIYAMLLVLRWLRNDIGGLDRMGAINAAKAQSVYVALDSRPDVWNPHAAAEARSSMNVAFRATSPEIASAFGMAAARAGFSGLDGHRSLGGFRASLYNAVTLDAAMALADVVRDLK